MRLYHSHFWVDACLGILLAGFLLAGCTAPQATQEQIQLQIEADGKQHGVTVPAGSTVQQALDAAQIELGALDRTEPALFTVATKDGQIRVIRVSEEFEVKEVIIPFERQTLRNESLPPGKENEVYLQIGQNGLQEITYRKVYEDGMEVSSNPVRSTVIREPIPEIIMVGIQTPFVPVAIPGRLIYLRDGNAWLIEETTGNRRAIITTGDLDGRVLALSDDRNWLLFTRSSSGEGQINSLWAMQITGGEHDPIDLKVPNVIQFADWMPGSSSKIVFSTVEARATAPGWQANNDLNVLTFSSSGWTSQWDVIIEPNSGGIYGWWGSSYAWSSDRQTLAIARPDGLQLVNFLDGAITPLAEIVPLLTRGEWAWVPGISWSPDGKILYTVDHVPPPGSSAPEESPLFDLAAVPVPGGPLLRIISQAGMFSYPMASPSQTRSDGQQTYQVAYLQAVFPTQSETSRYRLAVMDRDGSNPRAIFPTEGSSGITPQRDWGAWSPEPLHETGNYAIALVYQGNLWLIDTLTGQAQQVTGDGLTTRVIWK
jgi:hypothetical protein